MGGGITQQVYNNPDVRMLQEGEVSELKLDPQTWIHHNKAGLGGGIYMWGVNSEIEISKQIIFTEEIKDCSRKVMDGQQGEFNGLCYHNPSAAYNVFMS